jgi:diguanylate cyclase (GGDEF)-like protein/PAS domain S-box-containing protein
MTFGGFRSVYVVVLLVTVLIGGAVALAAWRRRHAPGARALAVLMLGQAWWSLGYALDLAGVPRPEPLFWSKMMFFGVVVGPAAFFAFTLQYTGRGDWVSKRTIGLLVIEPVFFLTAVWVDSYHPLVGAGYQPGEVFSGEPAFRINTAYSYLLMHVAGVLLIPRALRSPSIQRTQARLLLIGLLVVGAANALSLFHLIPWSTFDFTPVGFAASAAINALALFRYGLLDIGPVARHTVMERMRDGVIILDAENRVADLNPAAEALLGLNIDAALGRSVASLPAPFGEIALRVRERDFDEAIPFEHNGRCVHLQITALNDGDHRPGGWVVVLRDVSDVKRIESELRTTNDRLRQKLVEIESLQVKLQEQAIRDPLTDLYNRRFLKETLARELAQALRAQTPLSIAVIDLDHFKRINDTHGHHTGDRLLEALGDLLRSYVRGGDVACRYGGEEFVVVMPGAPLETAIQRADEWRRAFAMVRVSAGANSLHATFSAGVASFPLHGTNADTLLDAADRALYVAKAAGRNRVVAAEKPPAIMGTPQ